MRFGGGGRSSNLEDRRGTGGFGRAGLGAGGSVVALILYLLFTLALLAVASLDQCTRGPSLTAMALQYFCS